MMKKSIAELLKEKQELLDQVVNHCCWVNGSVVESERKQSGQRKPFYYLSQSVKGKNKITYVSPKHLESFKKAAEEGLHMKKLMSEISRINIALIKKGYSGEC